MPNKRRYTQRQMRLAVWSLMHLRNWFEVIECRRKGRPLSSIVLRNGLRLQVTAHELQPFYEIFAEKRYDHPQFRIPADGVVVDMGANVGIYSVYAATRLCPQGKVFAFEPFPQCAEAVEMNCRQNHLDNVTVMTKGIGKECGAVAFHIAERSGDSSMFAIESAKKLGTVEVISPASFFNLFSRIDLMKIDCEGGEFILLWETGAKEWNKVAAVSMEYHLGFNTGYPESGPAAICDRLVELGFEILSSQATKDPRFGYILAQRPAVKRSGAGALRMMA